MSVKLESTEQDLVDEVKVTVVVLSITVLCAAQHMKVTGNMYIESQNDNTFLALVTHAATRSSFDVDKTIRCVPVRRYVFLHLLKVTLQSLSDVVLGPVWYIITWLRHTSGSQCHEFRG